MYLCLYFEGTVIQVTILEEYVPFKPVTRKDIFGNPEELGKLLSGRSSYGIKTTV